MEDSLNHMRALAERWKRTSDSRHIFAEAYGVMTQNMISALGTGRFQDDEWISRLIDQFALRYFRAVDQYDAGEECPPVWSHAMTACLNSDVHPLQKLLLGINAHINYDLVFTLEDVLDDWEILDGQSRGSRKSDHDEVNRIIEVTIDPVQERVVAPLDPMMGTIDRVLGPVDEWVFGRLITEWRVDAWSLAISLLESDDAGRKRIIEKTGRGAMRTAALILTP